MTTFHKRKIDVEFQLGTGKFGATGKDTVTLKGHRVTANISKAGGISNARLDMRLFGVSLDVMKQLTVLGQIRYTSARLNQVVVSAGDDENGTSVAFVGIINEAWIVGQAAPEIEFHVVATSGHIDKIKPATPTSYSGSTDVATIISGIGAQMDPPRSLDNSGVDIRISDPYFPGTLMDQLRSVARAANIGCVLQDDALKGNVISIYPPGGSINGATLVISPDTGMVGYPSYTQNSIQVTTLYNPNLVYGRNVEVRSVLFDGAQTMQIASLTHNLEAETPNGAWFTEVVCGLPGEDIPIVQ